MRKLIGLFLIVAAVCLTACKEQEDIVEIVEINYIDSPGQGDMGVNDDYPDVFNFVNNNWGPVVPFDFNTDLEMDSSIWSGFVPEQGGQYEGATITVTLIVSFLAAATGIAADIMNTVRLAREAVYRRKMGEILTRCKDISKAMNTLNMSLNNLQHSLTNHINKTLMLLDNMDWQMELLDQQKRLTFITEAITKKNGTIAEFVNGDFINYSRALNLIDDYITNTDGKYNDPDANRAYHQLIYGMLNDWAGEGNKHLQEVLAFGNTLCGVTYVTQSGTLVGMPALYDQLTFDIKAWEHEGINNRAYLRLLDIMVWLRCSELVASYIVACQTLGKTAHGIDPYQLEQSFTAINKQIASLYSQMPIHEGIRICQVAGAHMVFTDTIIQELDYDRHSWYPITDGNSLLNEEKMLYGFNNAISAEENRKRQMPAVKADRLLNFYNNPTYTMVDSILVKHGRMTLKPLGNQALVTRNGNNYLLLNDQIEILPVPNAKWKDYAVYELRSSLAYRQVLNIDKFLASVVYFCLDTKRYYVNPYPTTGESKYEKHVNNHIYYIDVKQ